jgi:hypothetical protein
MPCEGQVVGSLAPGQRALWTLSILVEFWSETRMMKGNKPDHAKFPKDRRQMASLDARKLIFQEFYVDQNVRDRVFIHRWDISPRQEILSCAPISFAVPRLRLQQILPAGILKCTTKPLDKPRPCTTPGLPTSQQRS